MFRSVVHPCKHNIFECETLARAPTLAEELTRRVEQSFKIPLSSNGHNALADLVIGGIQRDCQLRPDGLMRKIQNTGHDPRSGDRHAGFGKADLLNQEANGLHKVVVIEERFPHSHEHDVHPLAFEVHGMVA